MNLLFILLRILFFYFIFKFIFKTILFFILAPKKKKNSQYKEKDIIDAEFKEL